MNIKDDKYSDQKSDQKKSRAYSITVNNPDIDIHQFLETAKAGQAVAGRV